MSHSIYGALYPHMARLQYVLRHCHKNNTVVMIHTKRISIHGGSVAVTLKPPIPNGTQGAGEKSSWRKERRGKRRCCLITARMYPFCTKEGWLPWAAFATSLRPHLMLSSLVVLLQARRLLDGSGEAKICWNESEWGDSCSQKNKWGPTALVEIFSTPQVKTSTCCCGCSHWKEYAFFPPVRLWSNNS